jgi:hypothetical protein
MPNVSYANLVVGFVWKRKAGKGHVHVHNFWLVYHLKIMKQILTIVLLFILHNNQ